MAAILFSRNKEARILEKAVSYLLCADCGVFVLSLRGRLKLKGSDDVSGSFARP